MHSSSPSRGTRPDGGCGSSGSNRKVKLATRVRGSKSVAGRLAVELERGEEALEENREIGAEAGER